MYATDDLRSKLKPAAAPQAAATRPGEGFHGASYGKFYETAPAESSAEGDTWFTRGQTLIVAYSKARPGLVLERRGQVDEYALMIPDPGVVAEVVWGAESKTVTGPVVVFIPKGDSSITARSEGMLFRLITTRNIDLAERCANAGDYDIADPNVAPYQPWPDPPGGEHIRAYAGDTPATPGRFGRLYRGSTIMVNFGSGRPGPRDLKKMSPHHHDDFEQYSVATAGSYIHHIRWPWTTNGETWRPDEHEFCATPSVAVIPPPSIHTSQGLEEGLNRLCDCFCPPRRDFSAQPGWVLNADDYPAPADLEIKASAVSE